MVSAAYGFAFPDNDIARSYFPPQPFVGSVISHERTPLAINISTMDDDPFNWGVDKVVRELCYSGRTWIPSPELPPAQLLEASLRDQGVDGHTILTYPNESKLCESLGIKTLKHENTFYHARCALRQQSPPATIRRQDSADIPIIKRKNEENHDQSRAKRATIEVIELSDDNNNNIQASPQQPQSIDNVPDNPKSRELDTEFGGRHANRHITEDDWAKVCKMFQCPMSTTNLRPPGFGIEIAAYQLHAIW
ncbi:hypothetical protein F5B18DRAFT_657339 [Nemania serpens]|nr:hypothetical protein F5B18DRAFT_657339 [Nemania serpens]